MNLVRTASLPILVLTLTAGCGGSEPDPKMPEPTSETSITSTKDTTPPAAGADSGHEGHAMSGAGATATAGATSPGSTTGSPPTADAAAATLTDEQILQVVHVANLGEIEQGKLAQQKAKNPKAKAFAAMMVKDHTDADAKGSELAKKNNLSPSDSPVSTALKADSDKTVEQLKSQSGADFDRAYIDAQVKAHQTVLDTINSKLMPSAKNSEVKTMLQTVQGKVEAHLKEAQAIQTALGAAK